MRTILVLIVLASSLCAACTRSSKPQGKGYVLNIDQDKIEKARDTIIGGKSYEFVLVPVELWNLTSDTLKYMTMTCSWEVIFTINKRSASILGWDCDSNFPIYSTVDPQKSSVHKIPILIEKTAFNDNYRFKIGIHIFKFNGYFKNFDTFFEPSKMPINDPIWSNEIVITK